MNKDKKNLNSVSILVRETKVTVFTNKDQEPHRQNHLSPFVSNTSYMVNSSTWMFEALSTGGYEDSSPLFYECGVPIILQLGPRFAVSRGRWH